MNADRKEPPAIAARVDSWAQACTPQVTGCMTNRLCPAPGAQSISQPHPGQWGAASQGSAGRSRALPRTWAQSSEQSCQCSRHLLASRSRCATSPRQAPGEGLRCPPTWLWCNRARPCSGRQLWVQRAKQNVPRLPKLLLSPSITGDPAHTSGHRCHTSLFSSFVEHCWRRGLCRGQASPVCGCAVGQRLGRGRVGQVALAGEALPVPAVPVIMGAWGR